MAYLLSLAHVSHAVDKISSKKYYSWSKVMSNPDKNDVRPTNQDNRTDQEPKRGKGRELTDREKKRLQKRMAEAKENDPNIYPLF
jgi:hypothetical protein